MFNSQTSQHLLDGLLHQIAWHRWRMFFLWFIISFSLLVTFSQTSENFINWQLIVHPVTILSLLLGISLVLPISRKHILLSWLSHSLILGSIAGLIIQFNVPTVEQLNAQLNTLWVLPLAALITTTLGLKIRQVRDFYQQQLSITYNQFVDWLGSMLAVPIIGIVNCLWLAIVPQTSWVANLTVFLIELLIFGVITTYFDLLMDRLVLIYRPQA